MNRIERIAGRVAGSMNLKEIKELGKEVATRVMDKAEEEIRELAMDYAERRGTRDGELDQEEMEKAEEEYEREAFRALAALAEKAARK